MASVRESIPQPTQGPLRRSEAAGRRSRGRRAARPYPPLGPAARGSRGPGGFSRFGHRITGHDRVSRRSAAALSEAGVRIGFGPSAAERLPEDAELSPPAAVSAEDPQVVEACDRGIEVIKYAQLVGGCPAGRTLAVAGTHGKTTTSWMLHVSRERGRSAAGAPVGGFTATTA